MPGEREGEEKNDPREGAQDEQPREEGVRFNDRRRVRVDYPDVEGVTTEVDDAPSLKPKVVEELEARTRAAEQKAADVQARFEQVRSQLQRETDEVRRRLNRNADERIAREKANFIASLLPVIDNLRRAIEAAESVESVAAIGEQFDPERHEAVDTVEVEPEQDGLVTAEYSRGYRMGDQLLRPARVQVGRARGEAQAAGE
jgi:molecular chaperone GrpE